jgi:5-methylcytosine-specific restriction endonuclease McrA
MEFFNRIEHETAEFSTSFFCDDLKVLANRHPKILKARCKDIYDVVRTWSQVDRSQFCLEIRQSNNIRSICAGTYVPRRIDKNATGVYLSMRELFLSLYNQVLDGNAFNGQYSTTLRNHFDDFSRLNSTITLCPICGYGELKKHTDKTRDQYDHYLPKAYYPLSSVNFENLVPICKECNSFDAKGETDVLAVASNGKLFFIFDDTYGGLTVAFRLLNDDIDFSKIEWQIYFNCPQGKQDEIASWDTIYKIRDRYYGFINGRIEKWYKHYWKLVKGPRLKDYTVEQKEEFYEAYLDADEELELNFLRKPALSAFRRDSIISRAAIEAATYSI